VFVLSLEIPITWGVFKETVKINLAEPILSTNHSPLDFSTPQLRPQCSRVHSQNTRSLAECQQFFTYWGWLNFQSPLSHPIRPFLPVPDQNRVAGLAVTHGIQRPWYGPLFARLFGFMPV
jgi:hypothetical protein